MTQSTTVTQTATSITMALAPAQVVRGSGTLAQAGEAIARLGQRPLVIGGDRTQKTNEEDINGIVDATQLIQLLAI